jgi:DNA-binding NarL/FixJ family response regulator
MRTICLLTEEPVLALGFEALTSKCSDLSLHLYSDAADLLRRHAAEPPDLLVIDFAPAEHISLIDTVRRAAPGCKVLLWVQSISVEIAYQVRKYGVRGILKKSLPEHLIIKCITKVLDGELWFDKDLTNAILDANAIPLTRREGQLVALVAKGLKNKEIATALDISDATVRIYLSALFRKLGVKDRYELAIYGMKNMPEYSTDAPAEARVPALQTIMVPRGYAAAGSSLAR